MRIISHDVYSNYPAGGKNASSGGNGPNRGGMYGDKLPNGGEDRTGKGGGKK